MMFPIKLNPVFSYPFFLLIYKLVLILPADDQCKKYNKQSTSFMFRNFSFYRFQCVSLALRRTDVGFTLLEILPLYVHLTSCPVPLSLSFFTSPSLKCLHLSRQSIR